jgi:membrane-bound lytic murein transglycosylase D
VVRRGDTLGSIAVHYGVPVQGIMEMNGLRSVKKLRVGTELVIPKPLGSGAAVAARTPEPARRPEAAAHAKAELVASAAPAAEAVVPASASASDARAKSTVRVAAGDTLWSIARRLGVELGELCKWNGIENPSRHKLLAGTLLVVYAPRG